METKDTNMETKDTTTTAAEINTKTLHLHRLCGHDSNCRVLQGIHYRDNMAMATDGRVAGVVTGKWTQHKPFGAHAETARKLLREKTIHMFADDETITGITQDGQSQFRTLESLPNEYPFQLRDILRCNKKPRTQIPVNPWRLKIIVDTMCAMLPSKGDDKDNATCHITIPTESEGLIMISSKDGDTTIELAAMSLAKRRK